MTTSRFDGPTAQAFYSISAAAVPVTGPSRGQGSGWLFLLGMSLALAVLVQQTTVAGDGVVRGACFAGAAGLAVWALALGYVSGSRKNELRLTWLLQKQHYIQACAHLSIYIYWGMYWSEVYGHAHLIVAQIFFAYAFESALSLSRTGRYTVGLGPLPIVFSTNLFLWFRDDWFYLQLLTIAIGFSAKEFIRWQRDGKSVHIFNPSSFPLAIVSICLIALHRSDMTWGLQISISQFWPAHMYIYLFLIALPGQYFPGIFHVDVTA